MARQVLALHLVFMGYGHWAANDPRGSGSTELRETGFADLGDVLWFDHAKRQAIAEAFGQVIATRRYTCWACTVLPDHAHLCIRRHRDAGETIWAALAAAAAQAVRAFDDVPAEHPIWARRPYTRFKDSIDAIDQCLTYIAGNPRKHGLPDQRWDFVQPYDGWPGPRRKQG